MSFVEYQLLTDRDREIILPYVGELRGRPIFPDRLNQYGVVVKLEHRAEGSQLVYVMVTLSSQWGYAFDLKTEPLSPLMRKTFCGAHGRDIIRHLSPLPPDLCKYITQAI